MAPTARADTRTLLSPEGNGQEIEEPLKPEDDLDEYDRKRLLKRLSYINGAAKRKITPRMQQFLKPYQDAYKSALDGGVPEKASCAIVQALGMVYYSAAFYLNPRTFEDYEHLVYYVKLEQLELLANYGDCLGQIARKSRRISKQQLSALVLSCKR
jgi:hypothetical protein